MQIQKSILIKIVNLTARNIHYPVKEWIHAAQNAFRDANDQYNNIVEILKSKRLDCQSEDYRATIVSLIPSFLKFRKAGEELSRAMAMFPHRILVVWS